MNRTEKYIYQIYNFINISDPCQLGIENVATAVNLPVVFADFSEAVFYGGKYKVFINQYQSSAGQWQDFGHEICHILRHDGDQKQVSQPFVQMQEYQAEYFAYHFCVPTFMLMQLREITIYKIMSLFNVEFEFARKRLEMFQNKIFGVINHERSKRLSI